MRGFFFFLYFSIQLAIVLSGQKPLEWNFLNTHYLVLLSRVWLIKFYHLSVLKKKEIVLCLSHIQMESAHMWVSNPATQGGTDFSTQGIYWLNKTFSAYDLVSQFYGFACDLPIINSESRSSSPEGNWQDTHVYTHTPHAMHSCKYMKWRIQFLFLKTAIKRLN